MTADDPRAWIGRESEAEDLATATAVRRLAALLDHAAPPWPERVLPPLAHWLYFLPEDRQGLLSADGHARRGELMPPIALPRRMWAGGRVEFHRPIPIGARMRRRSSIAQVVAKQGTTGELVFVTVRHQISVGEPSGAGAVPAVLEEQDIVYCSNRFDAHARHGAAEEDASGAAHIAGCARRTVSLGPVELFRFSALTFNAHRIHYDRDYARSVEGYPGLVVHGPYLAMLLLDHYLRAHPAAPVARLSYRAQSPLFEGETFELCAQASVQGVSLWAQRPHAIAMRAQLTL
jgi:3-methylfumaryl-CoA hydratase